MNPQAQVLVVDDIAENRDLLSRRLVGMGHAATTASHGREALEIMSRQPFDLVLLDIMMPEMNGYEVLERLKADPVLRHVPVVVISALTEVDNVARCIDLGADDYLFKPFNPVLLRARVGACLEKKRMRDKEEQYLARLQDAHRHMALEVTQIAAIQRALLPTRLDLVPGLTIAASHEIYDLAGGDLYDVFPLQMRPDGSSDAGGPWALLIADAAGHGASATVPIAMVHSLLHALPAGLIEPGPILDHVNAHLMAKNLDGAFVTALLAVYRPGTRALTYANAGHNYPFLISPGISGGGQTLTRLDAEQGPPLGWLHGERYPQAALELRPGQTLVFFTDGLSEAADAQGRMLGEEGLARMLAPSAGDPAALVRLVKAGILAYQEGTHPSDDQTIVAMRMNPSAAIGA